MNTPTPTPSQPSRRMINSIGIRTKFGAERPISEMTLHRWTKTKGFPKPDVIIGHRKFWWEDRVDAWIDAQALGLERAPAHIKAPPFKRGSLPAAPRRQSAAD